jgi:hypothetical protein
MQHVNVSKIFFYFITAAACLQAGSAAARQADSVSQKERVLYTGLYNRVPEGSVIPMIGVLNFAAGNASGASIGLINASRKSYTGSQIGLINATGRHITGAQIGFLNLAANEARSAQIGFVNASGSGASGVKIGFVNATNGNLTGAAIGFINATSKTITGPGIGIVNVSRKAKGLQIGFINVIDSLESGIPVGFLSFVRKNGYHAADVSANEVYPLNLSYRVGVRQLYSVLTASIDPAESSSFYGYSAGLGWNLISGKAADVAVEATANNKHDRSVRGHKFYYFTRLALQGAVHLGGKVDLVAGPALSYFTQSLHDPGHFPEKLPKGIRVLEETTRSRQYHYLWAGGSAGLRIRL